MSPDITPSRWQAALSAAAQQTLAVRWRTTLEALRAAQHRYRALYSAEDTDIRALRRAAKRIYDLEQLRTVLASEFGNGRPSSPGSSGTGTGLDTRLTLSTRRRAPQDGDDHWRPRAGGSWG